MITLLNCVKSQKHLRVILDKHLSSHEHIERKIKIYHKLIAIIKQLSVQLPRKSLLSICKSFIWPQFDYGSVIYHNLVNESLINKLEKVQYQACLAITGAIQGMSGEIPYRDPGLESLQSRWWYRKMIFFCKILNGLTPKYLFNILPKSNDICCKSSVKVWTYSIPYQDKKLQ